MTQRARLCAVAAGAALSATAEFAPTGALGAGAPVEVGDVIVTAQRHSENVQKVPITVAVVSGATLRLRQVQTNEDLSYLAPGLSFVRPTNNAAPFLRGVGFFTGTPGNEPAVATYVDGVYYPSTATSLHMFTGNLERVEILKGPQGTLYGRNAAGGVISIISKDPQATPGGDVEIGYASYATASAKFYGTTGLGANLAADILLDYQQQSGGWGRNLFTGRDVFASHEYAVRSKWVYAPSALTKITFIADYSDISDQRGAGTSVLGNLGVNGARHAGGFFDLNANLAPVGTETSGGVSARIEQDFAWASAISITAYRQFKGVADTDNDSTPASILGGDQHQEGRTWTQEFQLLSAKSSRLSWVAGLFLFWDHEGENPVTLFGLPAAAGPVRVAFQDTFSWAPYAQATASLGWNTRLTAGIRYTSDFRHQVADQYNYALTKLGVAVPHVDHKDDTSKITHMVTLDHDFTADVMGYVSHSLGFRSGNFSNLSPTNPLTKPQTVDATEIGIKSSFWNDRVHLNIAAFDYDLRDVVVQAIIGGPPLAINAASARSKGIDVEFSVAPSERLVIQISGEYLDARFTNFTNAQFFVPGGAAYVSVEGNADGLPLPYTEKYALDASVQYTVPTRFGDLLLSGAISAHDGVHFDQQNLFKQPAYVIFDASARWTAPNGKWTVTVWGKNLSNRRLYSDLGLSTLGVVYSPGQPRTFGVNLGYRF